MFKKILSAGLLSLAALGSARAEGPVRLIIAFPPGGPVDLVGRVLAEQLGKELKQQVIVENKAGANGNIAAAYVAKAPADGSVLFLTSVGAVAISPPIDFHMTLKAFQTGVNRGYDLYFLRKLKAKMERRIQLHADDPVVVANARKGLQAPWLRDYDEAVTAPEGGFASAHDYYTRSGVEDGLALIRVPTLILHAKDDPLIPLAMFEQRAALIAANPCLKTYFPDHGGHVGFMESPLRAQAEPWRDQFWAENEAIAYVRWLDQQGKAPVGGEAATG